ncbi:MAG: 3-oxoacyl-[acyl-carrier-protein] reductase FabG [Steroidobacteraceae bacterium]|nr:3-oxoacyl-[acyl-carrier-protein] reductase FabG [Steroidobacteraceae bacterium]
MSLRSPVILVTGASRGIGAATALSFARKGWRIAITARTANEGQRLDHQLRRADGTPLAGSLATTAAAVRELGAEVLAQPMDLMDAASLDAACDAVFAHYGRVDVLVNNAVYQDRESNALLHELTDEALERTLRGNAVAPFHLARRVLPIMVAQGGGRIVNVSSGAAKHDPPVPADQGAWGFAYGASKAALARLAGCINVEYRGKGISAFTVNPGLVSTEAVTATLGDGGTLEQRYGAMTPQAIAEALLWLVNDPAAAAIIASPKIIELQQLIREGRIPAAATPAR